MRKIDSELLTKIKYYTSQIYQIYQVMRISVLIFLVIPIMVGASGTDFDENTLFLIEKINTYIKNEYNEKFNKAFASFDTNNDGKLDKNELWYALEMMDVGTYMTRTLWVKGIMEYFDSDSISTQQLLDLSVKKYSSGIN